MTRNLAAVLIVAGLLGGASGCDYLGIGVTAKGKNAVRQILKNPGSATFRNVYVTEIRGRETVCGEVNSRDSKGDFVGYQRFYSQGEPENTFLQSTGYDFSVSWQIYCE